jgi:hypothetical protein
VQLGMFILHLQIGSVFDPLKDFRSGKTIAKF